MFDDFFINSDDIEELEKRFRDYLNGEELSFYATEDEFISLIDYYLYYELHYPLENALELALEYFPQSSEILFRKGMYFYLDNKLIQAKNYFLQSYVYDVENIEVIKYLIFLFAKLRNFDEAKNYFDKLNKVIYDDDWTRVFIADDFFKEVLDNEQLWLVFSENKELNNKELFLLNCSINLCKQIKDEFVLFDFQQNIIEHEAYQLACLKKFKQAKKVLEKSIEIDPYSYDAWIFLTILNLKDNQFELVNKSLEYIVAIEPELFENEQFLLGKMLTFLQRYHEAIPILENITQHKLVSRNLWEAYYLLGKCYAALQEYQVAIDCFEESYMLNNKNIYPNLEIASLYLELNKMEKASEYLLKATNTDKIEAEVYYLFAEYYLKLKKYEEGLKSINRALKDYPDDVDFILLKSEILEASGKTQEGIELLKRYLYEMQELPVVYYRIAGIYVELNEIDQAYEYLKKGYNKDRKWIDVFFEAHPKAKTIKKLTSLIQKNI
ncbi:MAG: tetratricopeptide repeat protein [Bacteroidales bacterium]|nr:tetratricopeptide repeat protein [Bacteroidales bacterium]